MPQDNEFLYKIKFPPGSIDGFLAHTLDMLVPVSQYHYHESGSTIDFTPRQLNALIKELEAYKKYAKEDPDAYANLIPDIDAALETIRKAVMQSKNIAQASVIDGLADKFHKAATGKMKSHYQVGDPIPKEVLDKIAPGIVADGVGSFLDEYGNRIYVELFVCNNKHNHLGERLPCGYIVVEKSLAAEERAAKVKRLQEK
jgi:hypothetical protein